MKKITALLIAMILMLSVAAFAEGTSVIMGIDPEFPPFSYIGDDGSYIGYDVEMAQAVAGILGWDLEIKPISWIDKLEDLKAGNIDFIWSGLTIDDIDANAYTLSFPYIDNEQVVVVKADSGIATLADLAGKIVGAQNGTSAARYISEGGELYDELGSTFDNVALAESYNVCFLDLNGGAIDAIAGDISILTYEINKSANPEDYVILEERLLQEQYGICFRQEDTELCAQVEDAIMQLVADGTYVALAEKYANVDAGIDVNALTLTAAE